MSVIIKHYLHMGSPQLLSMIKVFNRYNAFFIFDYLTICLKIRIKIHKLYSATNKLSRKM